MRCMCLNCDVTTWNIREITLHYGDHVQPTTKFEVYLDSKTEYKLF